MDGSPSSGTGTKYVLDTRPLLNFTYTAQIALLEKLLGRPIYVPAQVHEDWKKARARLDRKLREIPTYRHYPLDVQLFAHLQQARRRFRGNPFRVLRLYEEERDLALEFERDYVGIDPGESEVLAVCQGRGWTAVLDDRPAHNFAVAQGIATLGTLEILIEMVQQGLLRLNEGEQLLDEMRLSWTRAPRGKLSDYLKGRRSVW